MKLRVAVLSLPFAAPAPARAVVYTGNPTVTIRVDRLAHDYVSGEVELEGVRVHHCAGGSTDHPVGEIIDPVEGFELPISAGDHCGLTLYWGSSLDITGPGYVVRYDEPSTDVVLDDPIDKVELTPYSVVSGSMGGAGPWLVTSID